MSDIVTDGLHMTVPVGYVVITLQGLGAGSADNRNYHLTAFWYGRSVEPHYQASVHAMNGTN